MISDTEVVFRLFLAMILSGLMGLEREVKGRAAGFRTHILVCVGSALMMLTGLYLVSQYPAIDPARLAAQVVSGIGFLGAGTIIQFRDSVRGLTTAASVWTAAGIGIAVGAGFYSGAVVTTAVALVVLWGLHALEQRVGAKQRPGSH